MISGWSPQPHARLASAKSRTGHPQQLPQRLRTPSAAIRNKYLTGEQPCKAKASSHAALLSSDGTRKQEVEAGGLAGLSTICHHDTGMPRAVQPQDHSHPVQAVHRATSWLCCRGQSEGSSCAQLSTTDWLVLIPCRAAESEPRKAESKLKPSVLRHSPKSAFFRIY